MEVARSDPECPCIWNDVHPTRYPLDRWWLNADSAGRGAEECRVNTTECSSYAASCRQACRLVTTLHPCTIYYGSFSFMFQKQAAMSYLVTFQDLVSHTSCTFLEWWKIRCSCKIRPVAIHWFFSNFSDFDQILPDFENSKTGSNLPFFAEFCNLLASMLPFNLAVLISYPVKGFDKLLVFQYILACARCLILPYKFIFICSSGAWCWSHGTDGSTGGALEMLTKWLGGPLTQKKNCQGYGACWHAALQIDVGTVINSFRIYKFKLQMNSNGQLIRFIVSNTSPVSGLSQLSKPTSSEPTKAKWSSTWMKPKWSKKHMTEFTRSRTNLAYGADLTQPPPPSEESP
jgi:hypothetical protein